LVKVTVAPGTIEPERSVTVPEIREVVPWANATLVTIVRIARAEAKVRMMRPPEDGK
jgi:hypothetical protein